MIEIDYSILIIVGLCLSIIVAIIVYYITKLSMKAKLNEALAPYYTYKDQHPILLKEIESLKTLNENQVKEHHKIETSLAVAQNEYAALAKHHDEMKRESLILHSKFKSEFEALSQKILDEKSSKFTQVNVDNMKHILTPLQEKIKAFETSIEQKHLSEVKDRSALQKEIEHLRHLNMQLSNDANNLATALKGDNKTQGDWGEYRLEMLLEKSGLKKDIHFVTQTSFRDEEGQLKRPDFIINLPDNKKVIVDSKVSLKAYENYIHAQNQEERQKHISLHINSLRLHIRDLASKKYDALYDIETPNYVLMFVPLESALNLAVQFDKDLFLFALEKNIVLVSTSTLLATLRTISFIWTQDTQRKSVLEIARQGGLLYDKLHGFIGDLESIGQKLVQAQTAYHAAFNKLSNSSKKGDTILGRAEKLKSLGAITKKEIKLKENN